MAGNSAKRAAWVLGGIIAGAALVLIVRGGGKPPAPPAGANDDAAQLRDEVRQALSGDVTAPQPPPAATQAAGESAAAASDDQPPPGPPQWLIERKRRLDAAMRACDDHPCDVRTAREALKDIDSLIAQGRLPEVAQHIDKAIAALGSAPPPVAAQAPATPVAAASAAALVAAAPPDAPAPAASADASPLQKRIESKMDRVKAGMDRWQKEGRDAFPVMRIMHDEVKPAFDAQEPLKVEAGLDHALKVLGQDGSKP